MSGVGLELTPDARGIGLSIPASHANDPVTKAVFDNLMGNLPKKKQKVKPATVTCFCSMCNLEFSSQAVLDMHLSGSKHQRKVQSIQLMKSLEETESGFEKNITTGVITCLICNVTVNSPQLLATHVAGNKHQTKKKGKRENEGNHEEGPQKKLRTEDSSNNTGNIGKNATKKTPPKKKERPALDITIPLCVTKLEDNKTGGKFLCNPCAAHCNSDVQLVQHLQSKKHLDKVSQKKSDPFSQGKGRGSKGWNPRGGARGRGGRGGGRGGAVNDYAGNDGFVKSWGSNKGGWDKNGSGNGGWDKNGSGNRGYRGGSGARSQIPSKWSSMGQNANSTTSFSQKYSYDNSQLATSFSDTFGLNSPSSVSDFGYSRSTGNNRAVRGGRARPTQFPLYPAKSDELLFGRDTSNFRRVGSSVGHATAEYPNRLINDYGLEAAAEDYPVQEDTEYPVQAAVDYQGCTTSEYPSKKFEYQHNQRMNYHSSGAMTDYDSCINDYEYNNSYAGNGHNLGHNAMPKGPVTYTYTQPLSQNFVAGGAIL